MMVDIKALSASDIPFQDYRGIPWAAFVQDNVAGGHAALLVDVAAVILVRDDD